LNTVLRATKPESIFCSRTCRIASIEEEGLELPKGLALMNARDLKVMIEVGLLPRICALHWLTRGSGMSRTSED
jgi:hypothetical protein